MQFVIIENEQVNKEKGTLWLMGILFICFWLQWFSNEHFVNKLYLSSFSFLQLISHQFMHAHSLHLIINLVLLYVFGKIVETRTGIFALYILFVLSGISAGVAHLLFNGLEAAGASGAISGLIGSALVFDSRSKVYFLDRMFYVPVWIMAALWVAKDIVVLAAVPALRSAPAGHLGGFLFGVICAFLIVRLKKIWSA